MSASQIIATLFLLVGLAALGWQRQTYVDLQLGDEGARLLVGVTSLLLGGLLLLLSQLRHSIDH